MLRIDAGTAPDLDRLSGPARQCVQVASLLGNRFAAGELADLMGVLPGELVAPLREAIAAGLLGDDGLGMLAFRHDVVREAVGGTVPTALRRALRRQAVDVRVVSGVPVVDVARELAETAEIGDREAVRLLRKAATELATSRPDTAAGFSRAALDLVRPADPGAAEVAEETVSLLWQAGRAEEARTLADGMLGGLIAPETEARLRLVVAGMERHRSFAEAVRQCEIGLVLPEISATTRARLLAEQARNLALFGGAGPCDRTLGECEAGIEEARRHGRVAALCLWTMEKSQVLLDLGRLPDAAASAESVLAMPPEYNAGGLADLTARYVLGRVALHTGDQTALSHGLAEAQRMMRDEAPSVQRAGTWLAALTADTHGEPAGALHLLGDFTPPDPADDIALIRIAQRAGRRQAAEAVVAAAERRAELNPESRLLAGLAVQGRGLVDGRASSLVQAAELLSDTQRTIVRAAVVEDAAHALGRDDRERAVPMLEEALRRYEGAGAERDASRVRQGLRRLGVRRDWRAPRRGRHGWAALTRSELRVARLVASGATNRQVAEQCFLSPHTVSTHLRHAFAKLGVRSRVELTRIVLEHEGR